MIEAIVKGMGVGLILSLLTGPVFFALIQTSIEKGFKAGASLASGVFLSDLFYILIIYYGAKNVVIEEKYSIILGWVGGGFLIGIGIYYLLKKAIEPKLEIEKIRHSGYLLKGFLMNTLNPFVILYWIGIISYLSISDKETNSQFGFFAATLLTILSSDVLKSYIASKLRHVISSRVIKWLNRIAGVALIIFGLRMIIKVIFEL